MIVFDKDDVNKCHKFAIKFHSEGKSSYKKVKTGRKIDDIKDCARGKMGELGFKYFLMNEGINIELDFGIHKNRTDSGNDIISIDGNPSLLKYDVKTIKSNAKWFLISEHTADIYICMRVSDGVGTEIGWMDNRGFYDELNRPWFEYNNKNRNDCGNKLLSWMFVDECFKKAKEIHDEIKYRHYLYQQFGSVGKEYTPRLRIKLDAHNIALPLPYLRPIRELIPIIKENKNKVKSRIELRRYDD